MYTVLFIKLRFMLADILLVQLSLGYQEWELSVNLQ